MKLKTNFTEKKAKDFASNEKSFRLLLMYSPLYFMTKSAITFLLLLFYGCLFSHVLGFQEIPIITELSIYALMLIASYPLIKLIMKKIFGFKFVYYIYVILGPFILFCYLGFLTSVFNNEALMLFYCFLPSSVITLKLIAFIYVIIILAFSSFLVIGIPKFLDSENYYTLINTLYNISESEHDDNQQDN